MSFETDHPERFATKRRSDDRTRSFLFECRHCGRQSGRPTVWCRRCGSIEIARYELRDTA